MMDITVVSSGEEIISGYIPELPLRRPKCRWGDGIRIDLRETGGGWIGFHWLRIGTGGGLL
jgi:hypothetical protein